MTLFDLTVDDLKGIHPQFEDDVLQVQLYMTTKLCLSSAQHQKSAKLVSSRSTTLLLPRMR